MSTLAGRRELRRYSRHLLIPEVGLAGQEKLARARVLCVGAGGLGTPVLQYLAAAGVGRIGIVDDDRVDETNLQRQVIYATSDIGRSKAEAAAERVAALNPGVGVDSIPLRLDASNARELIRLYDVVVDATDSFASRYLINDACRLENKPDVYGSIFRFDGQVSVFAPQGPCYRCLFPEAPPEGTVPTCAEGGVLGVLAGDSADRGVRCHPLGQKLFPGSEFVRRPEDPASCRPMPSCVASMQPRERRRVEAAAG